MNAKVMKDYIAPEPVKTGLIAEYQSSGVSGNRATVYFSGNPVFVIASMYWGESTYSINIHQGSQQRCYYATNSGQSNCLVTLSGSSCSFANLSDATFVTCVAFY